MFSRILTKRSTAEYSTQIEQLQQAIDRADAVVIGAGAGLSTSAGFIYNGERFEQYFSDFRAKYGFEDMYTGGFFPFATQEEHWAYWSRYIWVNRYTDAPEPVYDALLALVADKDYFVLTTNVDHCFQKAGFDKKRLFYTQGDYGLFQCSGPCCQETWDNEERIRRMMEEQRDMRIPTKLLPRCPKCGKPLTMNLRSDDTFVQDKGWYAAAQRYEDFLRRHKGSSMVFRWVQYPRYHQIPLLEYDGAESESCLCLPQCRADVYPERDSFAVHSHQSRYWRSIRSDR